MPRHAKLVLEEDYEDYDDEDYDDEEDYYDEEEEHYDEGPAGAHAASSTPRQGGDASSAAQSLSALGACIAQPPRQVVTPAGTQQQQRSQQMLAQTFPLVPPSAAQATERLERFTFSEPDPDERNAQARAPTASGGTARAPTPPAAPVAAAAAAAPPPAAQPAPPRSSGSGGAARAPPPGFASLDAGKAGAAPKAPSAATRQQQQQQQQQQQRQQQRQQQEEAAAQARDLSEFRQDEALLQRARALSAETPLYLSVVGHVDAGKSTLVGHLLHDLGYVPDKLLEKHRKEAQQLGKASFAYAWVMDQRPEEREKGVTVDVGSAAVTAPGGRKVVILDSPGHRDFVPNMIAGATQADAAVLCVDVLPGGFESGFREPVGGSVGGQTREHALLVRSLGVEWLIVAMNKMDGVDFSAQRFNEVRTQLAPFLKSIGFQGDKIKYVPVSALSGENVARPAQEARLRSWYKTSGGTVAASLIETIERIPAVPRELRVPLRFMVTEVLAMTHSRALGKVAVRGRVEGGILQRGARVQLMPSGEVGSVRAIEMDGAHAQLDMVVAGASADVGLVDVDAARLGRGGILCDPAFPIHKCAQIEVRLMTLELGVPLLPGAQVVLHWNLLQHDATVTKLLTSIDSATGQVKRKNPRAIPSNCGADVKLAPNDGKGLCVERYKDYRSLGRVTLRVEGRTIAMGVVTKLC